MRLLEGLSPSLLLMIHWLLVLTISVPLYPTLIQVINSFAQTPTEAALFHFIVIVMILFIALAPLPFVLNNDRRM